MGAVSALAAYRAWLRSKSERLLFKAEAFVYISAASRSEVRIAHRLPRGESNLEILGFADRLWWPLELPKFALGHLATADLTKLLHERSVDLLGIPTSVSLS